MDTILYQKYSNYHIVFIDDASTDETFGATQDYMRLKGFPQDRIFYRRNRKKKFATFNIKTGSNYCQSGEIMAVIDGDD